MPKAKHPAQPSQQNDANRTTLPTRMKVLLMADRSPPKAKKHKGKTIISPTSSIKAAKQSESNPTFQLPADFDRDPQRYELWTVRLPIEIPLGDLDGIRIPLNHQDGSEETFDSGEKRYQVSWGKQLENESCRLLVTAKTSSKKKKDGDEDDNSSSDEEEEETEKEGFLYPSSRPFSRHLTVNEHFPSLGERTLAPAPEDAPPAVDNLRRAYVSVPQRTNLRRRWQMLGARVTAKTDDNDAVLTKPPPKRKLSEVDSTKPPAAQSIEDQKPAAKRKIDETLVKEEKDDDASETESARKAAKRARKEAKKAKKEAKEAKKAKKELKKMKKEQK